MEVTPVPFGLEFWALDSVSEVEDIGRRSSPTRTGVGVKQVVDDVLDRWVQW